MADLTNKNYTVYPWDGNVAFPGGSSLKNDLYTGPDGTLSIDTLGRAIRIHDGVKMGGWIAKSVTTGQMAFDAAVLSNLGMATELSLVSFSCKAYTVMIDYAISYALTSGSLPPGVVLNQNGTITGTIANLPGNQVYVWEITASDGLHSISRTFTLQVIAVNDAPVWNTGSNLGTFSGFISVQLSASDVDSSNLTYSVTSGILPAGLYLTSTGLLLGPNLYNNVNYSFTIGVSDGSNVVNRVFNLTMSDVVPDSISYSVPGTYSWVVPTGVTYIDASLIAGGGAGGGGANNVNWVNVAASSGGGGGAGGAASGKLTVTPGETLTINVGAAGVAGAANTKGGDGGLSAVKRGATTLLSCTGGIGGSPGSVGAVTATLGGNGGVGNYFTGGKGGNGAAISNDGQGEHYYATSQAGGGVTGGAAGNFAITVSGKYGGGGGGGYLLSNIFGLVNAGSGGDGSDVSSKSINGQYGGGGGGGHPLSDAGGAGGGGYVKLKYNEPPPTGSNTYNTPGTYYFTVPNKITNLLVHAMGGGGGGGGGGGADDDNYGSAGGGGGGGGASSLVTTNYSVTPGSTITIVVGVGGAGGYGTDESGSPNGGSNAVGLTGGTTTLSGGSGTVVSAGGTGGADGYHSWSSTSQGGGGAGGSIGGHAGIAGVREDDVGKGIGGGGGNGGASSLGSAGTGAATNTRGSGTNGGIGAGGGGGAGGGDNGEYGGNGGAGGSGYVQISW